MDSETAAMILARYLRVCYGSGKEIASMRPVAGLLRGFHAKMCAQHFPKPPTCTSTHKITPKEDVKLFGHVCTHAKYVSTYGKVQGT
jgi:hypothetical protein